MFQHFEPNNFINSILVEFIPIFRLFSSLSDLKLGGVSMQQGCHSSITLIQATINMAAN